jgi:hypothetical protein
MKMFSKLWGKEKVPMPGNENLAGKRYFEDFRGPEERVTQEKGKRHQTSEYERLVMDKEKRGRKEAFDRLDHANENASSTIGSLEKTLDQLQFTSDCIASRKSDYQESVQTIKDVLDGNPVPDTFKNSLDIVQRYKEVISGWKYIHASFKALQDKVSASNHEFYRQYQAANSQFLLVGNPRKQIESKKGKYTENVTSYKNINKQFRYFIQTESEQVEEDIRVHIGKLESLISSSDLERAGKFISHSEDTRIQEQD